MRPTLVSLASVVFLLGSTALAERPNIVLIVSDDQGYRDLGCYGSDEVLTPNLDRLAAEGVRLTDFYVTWPACTPSRGSLLTGRYPQRNGVYDMIRNEAPDYGHLYKASEYAVTFERLGGMDTREILLPRFLKPADYACGIFGKWDLGSLKRYLPCARGFDDFYGFVNTGIDYFTHERYGVPSMYRNNLPTVEDKGTYCTDLFRREALDFLERHHEQPFFLYLPFNAPHSASNLDPKIRSGAQATEKFRLMYPELQQHAAYTRRDFRYAKNAEVQNRAMKRLQHVASITCMDDAIGEVMRRLDQYGVLDKTLVIFLSDNGGGGAADNGELRGGKAQMYEGGLRVPCIVRYPKRLPAGRICREFLTSLEILPMILAFCGVESPQALKLDGFDMMPVLAGERASSRTAMFWQRQSDQAARVDNWKWVESGRGRGFFDLSTDIGEQNDLSESHPKELARVKAQFEQWQGAMEAAEPRGPFRDY